MYKLILILKYLIPVFLNNFCRIYKKSIHYGKFTKLRLLKSICALFLCFIVLSSSSSVKAINIELINSEAQLEGKLAFKYCQSIDNNLFEGLDKELILKYEYFFSSVSKDSVENVNTFLENFISKVYSVCNYEMTDENIKEFYYYFKKFYLGKIN